MKLSKQGRLMFFVASSLWMLAFTIHSDHAGFAVMAAVNLLIAVQ